MARDGKRFDLGVQAAELANEVIECAEFARTTVLQSEFDTKARARVTRAFAAGWYTNANRPGRSRWPVTIRKFAEDVLEEVESR